MSIKHLESHSEKNASGATHLLGWLAISPARCPLRGSTLTRTTESDTSGHADCCTGPFTGLELLVEVPKNCGCGDLVVRPASRAKTELL